MMLFMIVILIENYRHFNRLIVRCISRRIIPLQQYAPMASGQRLLVDRDSSPERDESRGHPIKCGCRQALSDHSAIAVQDLDRKRSLKEQLPLAVPLTMSGDDTRAPATGLVRSMRPPLL